MEQTSGTSRREFLRGIVRYAAAGTLLIGGGILVARRQGKDCRGTTPCASCELVDDCQQPAALAARQANGSYKMW